MNNLQAPEYTHEIMSMLFSHNLNLLPDESANWHSMWVRRVNKLKTNTKATDFRIQFQFNGLTCYTEAMTAEKLIATCMGDFSSVLWDVHEGNGWSEMGVDPHPYKNQYLNALGEWVPVS